MIEENREVWKQIGARIKKSRKNTGYTQDKLSYLVDVSVQYVSDLERGVVGASIPTLIRICEVLHVSTDYILMGRTDTSSISSPSADLYKSIQYLPETKRNIVDQGIRVLIEAVTVNEHQ